MQSVGRSVNLLLDVPPDTTGQIAKGDANVLMQFQAQRDAFLNRNILTPSLAVKASNVRSGNDSLFGPANVLDDNKDTYWAMADSQKTGSIEIHLGATYSIDAFITKEHIALRQRIGGYTIDAMVNNTFKTIVTGTSMGHKRIDKSSLALDTSRIRLRITQANATPLVNSFQVLGVKKTIM